MAGSRLRIIFAAPLAVLAALAALASPAAAAAARLHWHGCAAVRGAACATLPVPLDRTGTMGGRIPLKLAKLPAAAGSPTLVYLSGGPGGAGIEEMLAVMPLVPTLQERYRVIGFDQRGTGGSGLLRCPALERDVRLRSAAAGEDCARRLGPARVHYGTPDSVEDLEAIRVALGVDRLTLFGISYGTELALAYARAHPDHVDRLLLDSVVDPDDRDPFGLAGFRAMAPTLAALCPDRCRGVSADPAADLARLTARLREAPMHSVDYDRRGVGHERTITPTAIADLLYDADYNPPLRAAVPAAVRAALAGDAAPMARLLAEGDGLAELPAPRSFSSARYATVCEETPLPWDASTPIGARTAEARRRAAALGPDAFSPFDLTTAAADEIGLCLRWPGVPSGAVPAPAAPYPAVPTLILQGGEDLRTPPEGSADVAAKIPGAERVVVPGVGHAVVGGDPTGCGVRVIDRFLDGEAVGPSCPRVGTGVPATPPAPRRLGAVAPLDGLHGRAGRTARAVGITVDDLAFALSPAFLAYSGGGLRGGHFAVRGDRVLIHGYEAVQGVRLSGFARHRVLRLRVDGPAAAPGRVVIGRDGRMRGRLGGRRVDLRFPGAGSALVARTVATAAAAAAAAGRPPAEFRPTFARGTTHPRLVPSPAR